MSDLKIETKKTGRVGNVLSILILIIALCVGVYAGFSLYSIFSEYKAGTDEYSKIQDMVVVEKDPDEVEEKQWVSTSDNKVWVSPLEIDHAQLKAINEDYVGWLYVEAIPDISYPVVQGDDNSYYLHKTFEKADNFAGTVFIDSGNTDGIDSCNVIAYGHNMKNGSMFGQLKSFKDAEVMNTSHYIWFLTEEGAYKYEIFAAYTAEVDSNTYTLFKGPGQELADYALEMQAKDESGVNYTGGFDVKDNLLTLSTCTGDSSTRYVVQAVRIYPD